MAMEYRALGHSGLSISAVGLGCMNFGLMNDQAAAAAIVHRALDLGVNFFDTADVYGNRGTSEEYLGKALGSRRADVVIATKFAGPMSAEKAWMQGGSRRWIMTAVEGSLRRLDTDYIDLYQMHHIDRSAPWDEVWQAMETLVAQGKIIYVGSSNFAGWHLAQANEAARARHFLGLVSEQSLYNLVSRTIELEVLPACRSYGIGMIPWSPLAGGLLSGGVSGASEGRRKAINPRWEAMRPKLEEWEAWCVARGESPTAVALAWLLHQREVTAPIIGPRTLDQLTGASLRATEISLDAEALKELDRIFPGPGGRAPEAYAW